ncbi:GDP-L-fucose synthase family protein, partial [Ilyobacter sp.]|uniref:GDP-L-fucose synthase family protein n=1 Tax=Ilyobacter sp. TaxID=3100343 RepID=UPI0035620C1D
MELNSKIYLAGHGGMVGSALIKNLENRGYKNIIVRDFQELDLRRQDVVEQFFDQERPEYVFLAAAKVGGIYANNTYPAEFIYDNLMIEANIINSAHKFGVKKLLFLGSSCIYPKLAPQPIKEEALLTGDLETTNEAYAIAKIAGVELCKFYRRQYGSDFICVMPTNLYGPKDNFDLETSHVMPALIRKFHDAKVRGDKEVIVWGTGTPKREFLFVEDLTDALVHLMNNYSDEM